MCFPPWVIPKLSVKEDNYNNDIDYKIQFLSDNIAASVTLRLNSDLKRNGKIYLNDLQGRLIYFKEFNTNLSQKHIFVIENDVSIGTYLYKIVFDDGTTYSGKFLNAK